MQKIKQLPIKNIDLSQVFRRLKYALNVDKDNELADILGLKQNTISTYKKRKSVPYKHIITICDQYNIDLNWVLSGDIPQNQNELQLDPAIKDIIDLLSNLNENELLEIKPQIQKIIDYKNLKNRLSELESKIEVK